MQRILAARTWILFMTLLVASGRPARAAEDIGTRNNSYALLHQLLDEQKDVSMLRLIKREGADLADLTKRIAATSAAGAGLLEEIAKKDASIRLDEVDLPPGEVAARAAIAKSEEKELLTQKGAAFRLGLLVSQVEALDYASHLADTACENEANPDRARALAGISEDMRKLHGEAMAMLLSNMRRAQ
jgi:hypothetical protein